MPAMVIRAVEEPIPQPVTDHIEPAKKLPWDHLPILIAADSKDQPDIERPELAAMKQSWRLGDILMGGIEAIKANADELLPPLGADETSDERDARLRKAIATPFYQDNIDRLVSKPFGRAVKFEGGELPESLRHLIDNADGHGRGLTALGRDHLFDAIHRGGDALLVDLLGTEEPQSQQDVLNRKPIIRQIGMADILGWEYRIGNEGEVVTTMLRLRENQQQRVGMFGVKSVPGIRILQSDGPNGEVGFSVRYEQNEKKEWVRVEQKEWPAPRIRLHATWTKQVTATSCKSSMTHLAELNAIYVAGDCEQNYGASYARLSTLYTVGADPGDEAPAGLNIDLTAQRPVRKAPKRVTRGHKRHIRLPEGSTIGLLESSGQGLAAGRAEQDDLKKRMELFASSHMSATSGVTATAVNSDDERDTSNLNAWVTREESTLDKALRDCADLLGERLPESLRLTIFRDWAQATEREQAMPHVLGSWDRQLVPARIVHDGLRRYGALRPEDSTEDLLREAQEEADQKGQRQAELELQAALDAAAELKVDPKQANAAPGDKPDAGDPAPTPSPRQTAAE